MIRDEKTYTDFIKRMDSLSYLVKNDLEQFTETKEFNHLLMVDEDGGYPPIINKYLEEEVSLETVCVLDKLTGFIEWANQLVSDTILWPEISDKVTKYKQFLEYDEKKMRNLIVGIFK